MLFRSIIYTGGYYWDPELGTDEFNDHPLWHAGYTGGSYPTTVPNAWSSASCIAAPVSTS